MNNDLEQFSEEKLIDIIEFRVKPTPLDGVLLARIALSAMQADVVAYVTYKGQLLHAADPKVLEHSEPQPLYDAPQPARTEQAIKITQSMLDAAAADYCTTGKYTVENIPYELRRQVEFEAECTFKAMLAAAPKPENKK